MSSPLFKEFEKYVRAQALEEFRQSNLGKLAMAAKRGDGRSIMSALQRGRSDVREIERYAKETGVRGTLKSILAELGDVHAELALHGAGASLLSSQAFVGCARSLDALDPPRRDLDTETAQSGLHVSSTLKRR